MHSEVVSDKPGRCSKCGMKLVKTSEVEAKISVMPEAQPNYMPLFVIIGIILLTSLAIAYPMFNAKVVITSFMAGFFIVFASFKLIDLRGFAQGYSTYDLLAKKFFAYGYIYPFIELFFGISMILGFYETQILVAEIMVMSFSGIGVALKLMKHERFQCVCLGTFLKVPLTYVTLAEDFGMAALAMYLLFTL